MSSVLSVLPRLAQKMRGRLRKVLFYDHWMIGVVDQPIGNALAWKELPSVRWLEQRNRKRYLADPFPWPGSADTLLCEEFDVATRKGHLTALKLKHGAIIDEMKVELPFEGHLSFPFLFMHDGQLFMLPESSADKRLDLFIWRLGAWVLYHTIVKGRAVADAVLFEKDGLLWISCTDVTEHPHDNLHLIYAADLAGPWTLHPSNPVSQGVERSRNGGAYFTVDGRLYRPAQDCSKVYGGSMRIMEVLTCTTNFYEEVEVTHIVPSSRDFPHGFHTLSAWGDKCLIDGMRVTFSTRMLWHKLIKRLGLG